MVNFNPILYVTSEKNDSPHDQKSVSLTTFAYM